MVDKPICRVCDVELDGENWTPLLQKGNRRICKYCNRERARAWIKSNPIKARCSRTRWKTDNMDKTRAYSTKHRRNAGISAYTENKKCPLYLGVHVAERVLSKVFKHVERIPMNNHGYDFVCNRGYFVDVKSACQRNDGGWDFRIKRNTTADYFLCLAFDNRDNLNPLHIWLLHGSKFNHFVGVSIRPSTIHKWDEYRLNVERVSECCHVIKGT